MNTKKKKINAAMIWGAVIVGILVFVALFAPVLAPYDPFKLGIPCVKPCAEHPLGNQRCWAGSFKRTDLWNPGFHVYRHFHRTDRHSSGSTAGTCGRLLQRLGGPDRDSAYQRNHGTSKPCPLTVLLTAYLSPGKLSMIIAISLTAGTGTSRILRSRVVQLCEMPFVKIEKAIGMNDFVIMVKHILPNLKDIILSRAALSVSSAIMMESSLSFLGLGS